MDTSLWGFMKQFATGTAVLKTPRPITFELAFLAAVAAAAACETSHTYVSPWDGGSALHCLRFLCPGGWAVLGQRKPRSLGPGHLPWMPWWSTGLSCPVSNCPVNWRQQELLEKPQACWDLGQGHLVRAQV